jgi:hypothetical protein
MFRFMEMFLPLRVCCHRVSPPDLRTDFGARVGNPSYTSQATCHARAATAIALFSKELTRGVHKGRAHGSHQSDRRVIRTGG